CVVYGLIPVLNSVEQIRAWRAQARREGSILPAAIQGDTGMARLGLAERDGDLVSRDADALEGIAPTLVMSHLVSAEDPLAPVNQLQLMRFRQLRQLFPQAEGCLANSSAIFLGSEYHFDLVRPGAALYGVAPTVGMPNPLKPVIRVQARLLQWRNVEDGAGVGYNHTWQARRATRIGTISIGYADGFLRSASNSASVRFSGRSLPVIGRVSMDTVTVDVTEVPPDLLVPGALFDVIDEIQDINELARQAGTNAYEILTSLGARYRRHYASEQ
ncbi:MAG: alanine racemase, partial [Betaproteobacteria bacterium]